MSRIVLVNAMVPVPGETPGEWFSTTGAEEARRAAAAEAGRSVEFDLVDAFLHDIPEDAKAGMIAGHRDPAGTPFTQKCAFALWPDVPTHVLTGADDRMFPAGFQARVARERLGVEPDVIPGGHLMARSRPVEVAERLIGYAAGRVPIDLADAAAELARVVRGVRDEKLDAPTPCAEWTLRDLLGHVCQLPVAFVHVARHEPLPDAPERAELSGDWREQLARGLTTLVGAWRTPQAWAGETSGAGVTLPNTEWARVVVDELVVHGWDVATATGQAFTATETDVEICTDFAEAFADLGEGGPFAASLAAAPGASALDRLLARTGREPGRR